MEAVRVLIAASGSGGHLLPAVYIAGALKDALSDREADIHFVGTGSRLEPEIIDSRGYPRHIISVGKIAGMSFFTKIKTVLGLVTGFVDTWKLISALRPNLVIGVGGYASFLPVTIARMRGIPTWIHEAERDPGIANRILAWYSSGASVALPNSKLIGNYIVYTGHPVRPELGAIHPRTREGGPPKRILILGGSQGSRAVDEALSSLAPYFAEHSLEVWHQSRPENIEPVREAYERCSVKAKVETFIQDILGAYSWADIIISRAGAGSVMEIGIANRPAVLIPLATATGAHQRDNALLLANAGKGIIVEEGPSLLDNLRHAIERYLDPDEYFRVVELPSQNRSLGAAARIALECQKLLR